jgi:minor histocompatibility antigen H13
MTGYFVILGAMAMSHLLAPILRALKPSSLAFRTYHLSLKRNDITGDEDEVLVDFKVDAVDMSALLVSSAMAVWYLLQKHWVANNIFGIAFAVNGVELLHLNSVTTGCILLSGLFFYDVFWVFGTDVMVTVAKSFEAPIKLVFPQDFLERGVFGTNFAMLGLGDIVIPGIFIALLLRFDRSLNRSSNTYFNAAFIAYIIGLVTTMVVMSVFKHAQPALLYLVPACISFPVLLALLKGDFKAMFQYEDHPKEQEAVKSE